jgi:hypothetical protein
MKTILKILSLMAPILAVGCNSSVPPISPAPVVDSDSVHLYLDDVRGDLSDGNVIIINSVMQLTTDEDKIFWPIYDGYEQEMFALGNERMDIMDQFVVAQNGHLLTNAKASELSAAYFRFEEARLQLVEKYSEILSKELSPIRAAQFAQVEHRISTVTDLMIASQTPLIQHRATDIGVSPTPTTQHIER